MNKGFDTVGGATPSKPRDTVDFTLANLEGDVVFDIVKTLIVNSFHLSQRPVNIEGEFAEWPHLSGVPLRPNSVEGVSLIIGLDYPALHSIFDHRIVQLNHRAPRDLHYVWMVRNRSSVPSESDVK